MLTALTSGALLGACAGLAPGPLLALVLTQSLRHGPREGCKIALAPLLTDAPLIALAWVLAARLAQLRVWLGVVSLAGGVFVLYLAWESLGPAAPDAGAAAEPPRSWFKGILTNLLNPHPWLFWLTIGAASLARALAERWSSAVGFLFGFYLLLVGSKVVIALLAGRARDLLAGRPYRVVMRVLAVLLACFAVLLLRDGLERLAVR